jgi:holliday junction DNA helicase RuvA
MIGRISGTLIESAFTEIIVDANGVGYLINIPMSTYDTLPRVGEKTTVLTYMYVREDALELFGFASKEEKQLFRLLLSVSGVGPKVALNILSAMSVQNFCSAVANADVKTITTLKGLGKKTSERLVLELKGKVAAIVPESQFGAVAPAGANKSIEEATLALAQLGFKHDQAATAVRNIAKDISEKECSAENLIKLALSSLNK